MVRIAAAGGYATLNLELEQCHGVTTGPAESLLRQSFTFFGPKLNWWNGFFVNVVLHLMTNCFYTGHWFWQTAPICKLSSKHHRGRREWQPTSVPSEIVLCDCEREWASTCGMWYWRISRPLCDWFLYVHLEVAVIQWWTYNFYFVEPVQPHSIFNLYDSEMPVSLTLPKAPFPSCPQQCATLHGSSFSEQCVLKIL